MLIPRRQYSQVCARTRVAARPGAPASLLVRRTHGWRRRRHSKESCDVLSLHMRLVPATSGIGHRRRYHCAPRQPSRARLLGPAPLMCNPGGVGGAFSDLFDQINAYQAAHDERSQPGSSRSMTSPNLSDRSGPDTIDPLILDLLERIGPNPRVRRNARGMANLMHAPARVGGRQRSGADRQTARSRRWAV